MTDITDQDRRAAREWAEYIADNPIRPGSHAWMNAVARVILATVDAPDPTLADELWGLFGPEALEDEKRIIARAEQIEQERDDLARARESQEKALHGHGRLLSEARAERDEARAEVASLTEDLAGAAAEVVRLHAEVRSLQFDKLEGITAFGWMEQAKAARAEVERLTAERDRIANGRNITFTEMDGKPLPDPDEVPDGEAGLVEVNGERRAGIRSKNSADYDGEGWSTSPAPMHEWWVEDDRITLITRLVPAPRVITNPDDFYALEEGTIVRAGDGHAWENVAGKWRGHKAFGAISTGALANFGPVTVLWEAGA